MTRLAPCRCGHPGLGCSCYEERRAEADAADRPVTSPARGGPDTAGTSAAVPRLTCPSCGSPPDLPIHQPWCTARPAFVSGGPDTAEMREARSGSTSETCMEGAGVQVSALAAYLQQRFAPPGPFGFATRDWRIEAEQLLALPVVQRLAVEKAAEVGSGVWIHPARRSGEPCCGGTRVPVEMVIEAVWAHGVDVAMDTYCLTRTQVLHACWYAGAGNVVRLHGPDGDYVARRGPWRRRWGAWAGESAEALWNSWLDAVDDPPTRALAAAAQPTDGRTGE